MGHAAFRCGPARKIADATIYVPDTEPDLLWAISYPGGADSRIGNGTPTLRLLATNGQTLAVRKGPAPSVGTPFIGVAKRVVFELAGDRGLAVWDPSTGKLGAAFGGTGAQTGDTRGRLLSWCDGTCGTIHFTDVTTGADITVALPDGLKATRLLRSRFSPGFGDLAVPVSGGVVLVDPGSRSAKLVLKTSSHGFPSVAWSPDSSQLFVSNFATTGGGAGYETYNGEIGRWDRTSDKASYARVTAPLGNATVAITNDEARTFLR